MFGYFGATSLNFEDVLSNKLKTLENNVFKFFIDKSVDVFLSPKLLNYLSIFWKTTENPNYLTNDKI